jgi:glutathione S-transferase
MSYVLYGSPGSGSTIAELALAEIGDRYEFRDVSLERQAQRDAAYAAVNPQRKLPALITPEGDTLTESSAIVLALDERHPEAKLLPPPGSRERAQALRWLLFAAAELYPIVEIVDYPERFTPDAAAAAGVRTRAGEIWRTRLSVVEWAIAGSPWLLASGFCAVDVYLAVVTRWCSVPFDWRREHLPKIEALAAGVRTRPTLAEVWRRNLGTR